ncbi:MAG: ATPase, partial [Bacteroidales bacterium]|nr:ATPase [Bacteroidales bacterium]
MQIFWDKKMPLGAAHREAQKNLRLYMLVGGMPQAINAYLDTNNLQAVDEAKRRIIRLYEEDFIKIDPTERVSKLFMSIPSILARNVSRYVPSSVIGEVEENKTVNMSHHADDPNVGLPTAANYDKFKLYVGDTGLFITLAFWDKDFTENVIYDKLLTDKLPVNLG